MDWTPEELLPCPFCGGAAQLVQIGNNFTKTRGYEVKCQTWGCMTVKRAMVIRHSLGEAKRFAVERWNQRAPNPADHSAADAMGRDPLHTLSAPADQSSLQAQAIDRRQGKA